MTDWISVDEASSIILSSAQTNQAENVGLEKAGGRVLARDYVATIDSPPFTNSAMDGVAFRYEDYTSDGDLKLVGTIAAGDDPSTVRCEPNNVFKIMTGAPLPSGLDSVVMREHVFENDGVVKFSGDVTQGMNVRRQGIYVRSGESTIASGTKVDAGVVSLLATYGFSEVEVVRLPRVTIITTGSELVPITEAPGPGQIRNSNAWMLAELCRQCGVQPIVSPIIVDEADAVRAAFTKAVEASDVVVSVGGVSVGDFDFVGPTITELSDDVSFWRIKMKPGKPLTHGKVGGTHLVGLPGNPMSCFVTFNVFVAPLLKKLSGQTTAPRLVQVKNAQALSSTPKRREYITGRIESGRFVRIGEQSSGDVSAMAGCTALAIVEEGESAVEADELIDVLLID